MPAPYNNAVSPNDPVLAALWEKAMQGANGANVTMLPSATKSLDPSTMLTDPLVTDGNAYDLSQADGEHAESNILSDDHQAAVNNFDKNFPGANNAAKQQSVDDSSVPSAVGTSEETSDPDAKAKAKALADMKSRHPDESMEALNSLVSRIIKGNSEGGEFSPEAMQSNMNALAPVNAAQQFGQNQMMGAGTKNPVANPRGTDFNGQFAQKEAQLGKNLGNIGGAINTQFGTSQMLALPQMMEAFKNAKTPQEKAQIAMQLQMSPNQTVAGFGKALLESPDLKAYTAGETAKSTKAGENAAAAQDTFETAESRLPNINEKLDRLAALNADLPSGSLSKIIDTAAAQSQGSISAKQAAAIVEARNLAAQLALAEIPVVVNGQVRYSRQLGKLMEKGSSFDTAESPAARAAAINSIKNNVYQAYSQSKEKARLAKGGEANEMKAPPAYGTGTSIPFTLNGEQYNIPSDKVQQFMQENPSAKQGQ